MLEEHKSILKTQTREQESPSNISDDLFSCIHCGNKASEYCCQDCEEVYYCSEECAQKHWPTHQRECKNTSYQAHHSPLESKRTSDYYSSNIRQGKKGLSFSDFNTSDKKLLDLEKPNRRISLQFLDISSASLRLSSIQRTDIKDDEDEFKSDDNAPNDTNLNKAKARRRILYHLYKENYERARQYAEGQYQRACISLRNVNNDSEYLIAQNTLDDLVQDFLMYSKCLLLANKDRSTIRNTLLVLTNDFLSSIKINYKEVRNSIEDRKIYKDFDLPSVSGKAKSTTMYRRADTTDFVDVKRILHVHGIIAAMYKGLGDSINAEKVYVKYCKIIERIFGIQSVEASNCYYYIGAYYYEEKQYGKALLCMKKALYNRKRHLGEVNTACGDCHFNIGMIYKKEGKVAKAKKELRIALTIRRETVGRCSLPCARVLEELGKLELENGEYSQSLIELQECYNIRKKIMRNNRHPDIVKVSLLLTFLSKKLGNEATNISKQEFIEAVTNKCIENIIKGLMEDYINQCVCNTNKVEESIEEVSKDASVSNLIVGGCDQLFKYHKEDPLVENVINGLIFILSLNKYQLKCFTKSQIDVSSSTPLFISDELKDTLSSFQLCYLDCSNIHLIPKSLFLKDSQGVIGAENLNVSVIEYSSINDNTNLLNINTLIQSNSDIYKVLNSWQVDVLTNVITHKLPFILFLKSIRESQLKELEEIMKGKEIIEKTYTSNRNEVERKIYLQKELIDFINTKLNENIINNIKFDVNDDFCINLNHDQLILIAQINQMRNKGYELEDFKERLLEFVKVLDQKEIYLFAMANSFMIECESSFRVEKSLVEESEIESVGDSFEEVDKVKEENKFLQNLLQNPTLAEELRKSLSKPLLKMVVENPSILKQFLVKPGFTF